MLSVRVPRQRRPATPPTTSRRPTGGLARPHPSRSEVLVGMIHEYARHLGHADLLRERIDGRIGQ
jgi:hypothetical protein